MQSDLPEELSNQVDRLKRFYGESITIVLFVLAAAYVAFVGFRFAGKPVSLQLLYVADDAFYYLQIARQIAAGHGSTFDGINPTNGYQPAWMLVCVLLALFVKSKIALLHVYIVAEFLTTIASGVMMGLFLRRYTSGVWAWAVAAIWILSPMTFSLSMFGVETPLYFCALLFLAQRMMSCLDDPSDPNATLFGIACGLAIFCRTDAVFPSVVAAAIILIRNKEDAVKFALRSLPALLLTYLPWIIVSFLSVHTLTQDSGAMKALWKQGDHSDGPINSLLTALVFPFSWIEAPLNIMLCGSWRSKLPLFILTFPGLLLSFRLRDQARVLAFWSVSTIALSGLAYGFFIGDVQWWHYALPGFLLFLSTAILIGSYLPDKAAVRRMVVSAAAIAAAVFMAVHFLYGLTPFYPWQPDVLASQFAFTRRIPLNANIGSFNAGIPAYFGDRTVFDLDGLVNHTAVAYWKEKRLTDYLKVQHISYIIDEQGALQRSLNYCTVQPTLHSIAAWPLTDWVTPDRHLWYVLDPSSSPVPVLTMPLGDSVAACIDGTTGLSDAGSYGNLPMSLTGHPLMTVGSVLSPQGYSGEGHAGAGSAEILRNCQSWAGVSQPVIILLQCGTDDIRSGESPVESAQTVAEIARRLRQTRPMSLILVSSVPPMGSNNAYHLPASAASSENSALKAAIGPLSKSDAGIQFVDIYKGFPQAYLGTDGIHPDSQGYAYVYREWSAYLGNVAL